MLTFNVTWSGERVQGWTYDCSLKVDDNELLTSVKNSSLDFYKELSSYFQDLGLSKGRYQVKVTFNTLTKTNWLFDLEQKINTATA